MGVRYVYVKESTASAVHRFEKVLQYVLRHGRGLPARRTR